jgi:hypothetical protein
MFKHAIITSTAEEDLSAGEGEGHGGEVLSAL